MRTRVRIDPPRMEFQARPLVKLLNEQGEEAVADAVSSREHTTLPET